MQIAGDIAASGFMDHAREVSATFQKNRIAVIIAVAAIEDQMCGIIERFLFSDEPYRSSKRGFFETHILASEWCSFANKLRLVVTLAKQENLLEKKALEQFEKDIRRAMRLRNAFTHGQLRVAQPTSTLHFYEGAPRSEMLTDQWLELVEAELHLAERVVSDLRKKCEARWPMQGEPERFESVDAERTSGVDGK